MRLLIILIFLSATSLFSIDVTNYYSESPRITGIHDSNQFGLIISNSDGVFRIDKSNGNFQKIPFDPDSTEKNFNPVNQTIFFEYNGELHSYSSEHELHRVRDGKYEMIASYVVAHLVSGDKLYILRSIQPRVQIFQNDVVTSMNHGSKHHSHEVADLVEVNGSVYGLVTLSPNISQ